MEGVPTVGAIVSSALAAQPAHLITAELAVLFCFAESAAHQQSQTSRNELILCPDSLCFFLVNRLALLVV
jgi:hypothetical protein